MLVMCFRLRRVSSDRMHRVFRWESELNTVLFAGFPGLVSKLWLTHDERGRYRGMYEWDGPELAGSYARSLWWALAVASSPSSMRHVVLPGLHLEELMAGRTGSAGGPPAGRWWQPVPDTAAG